MLTLKSVAICPSTSLAPLLWPEGEIHTPNVRYDSVGSMLAMGDASVVLRSYVVLPGTKLSCGMLRGHCATSMRSKTRNTSVDLMHCRCCKVVAPIPVPISAILGLYLLRQRLVQWDSCILGQSRRQVGVFCRVAKIAFVSGRRPLCSRSGIEFPFSNSSAPAWSALCLN